MDNGQWFQEKISEFCNLLIEANKSTNLVSKNDEKKLMTRHVADSLMFAQHCPLSIVHCPLVWVDIGSGAGFPVVPLSLHFPHMKFFAVECRKKRVEFLNFVKQKLDLQNFDVIQAKAPANVPAADFVSCRAVGSLHSDFEIAKKILKKGGCFLTVKSMRIIDELREKNDELLKKAQVLPYRLPQEEMEYALVAMEYKQNKS